MPSERPFRVAIVGGGPAGAALAVHLATDGADVALFADEERREIVVGESLVPAIVPSLRRLGVEDAVAAVSQVKPGVAFEWAGMRVAFTFSRYGHRMTPYAYNAPRPEFEEAIRARAIEKGARVVPGRVKLARGGDAAREVELDAAARAAGGWGDGASRPRRRRDGTRARRRAPPRHPRAARPARRRRALRALHRLGVGRERRATS
jgi:2-polyprenyl-6-methoxyphenol hydroxylase-like FAD-dependent oxidoreductase